jgi:hypothetical protein
VRDLWEAYISEQQSAPLTGYALASSVRNRVRVILRSGNADHVEGKSGSVCPVLCTVLLIYCQGAIR